MPLDDLRLGRGWPAAGRRLAAIPEIVHRWSEDGWDDFHPMVMAGDTVQRFDATVANGRGVITAAFDTPNVRHMAYIREGTLATDSEIVSPIYPPVGWNGNNAQQGHLHNIREIAPGVWEAIMIWTSVVFGGDYGTLHMAGVRWDGTALDLSAGGFTGADQRFIDHTVRVLGHRRFNFGVWINEYTLAEPVIDYAPGDIVTVSLDPTAGFNETNVAVTGWDPIAGIVQVLDPSDTAAVAYTPVEAGMLRHSGVDSQKRWAPFMLATRVIGGTAGSVQAEAMRWRLGTPPADWGDPRVQRITCTPDGDVTAMAAGPGGLGLFGAHFNAGSSGSWGDGVVFRRLR